MKKILYALVFSSLLTGFTSLMLPQAYAAAATMSSVTTGGSASGQSTETNKITVVFNQRVYVATAAADGATVDEKALFNIGSGAGVGITSANVIDVDVANPDAIACTNAGASATVTLVLTTPLSTSATPTVSLVGGGTLLTCDGLGTAATDFSQAATDGLKPTVSVSFDPSAPSTVSTITASITWSESVTNFIVGDMSVSKGTLSGFSGSGASYSVTWFNPDTSSSDTLTISQNSAQDGAANTGPSSASTNTYNHSTVGGNACIGDCAPPTLGIDQEGVRIVTNGFTYNGKPIDVEKYYTPYPLITVQTGVPNTAVFKIYEDMGPEKIAHLDFAFGLAKGQILQESKARIEWNNNYGKEAVNLVDPENVLANVSVTHKKVFCNETGTAECLQVTIKHTFMAPLEFDIVATNVWDQHRNAWQNYYNHGIHVSGDSFNPPKEYDGIFKGHIFHLTETGKNTAVDNSGDSWSFSHGIWSKDYILSPRIIDGDWQVMKRTHSEFNVLKENQVKVAKTKLLEICPACGDKQFSEINDIYTIYMTGKTSKIQDPEILKQMDNESAKASIIMKHMFDSIYPNKVFD